jgi:hypothetical protein
VLEGEIELLQGLVGGKPRLSDACLAAVGLAAVDLGLEQGRGELLIAPLLGAGSVGELAQRVRGGGGLELSEQVG